MAGQLATASFDHQHPQAPDNRMQRPNLNARNEISPWIRWEGMQVYVVQEQKTYQLVGGTGNEHWQEIAAGGGASNFVGQFPTFDDLPNSGSPGDYAYVGTGDDFVQYNWDQIAGEWRLNSAETKVSDEDFFLGRVPSEPDRVMFSMRRNSIIYSTGGAQSISPDRMANYIFTGENVTLENVNYDTEGNEEFHITNRTGSNLTILGTGNFASGLTIPAGHMASFKSSNDGWVQSYVNEELTFYDTINSVLAVRSTGPDGLEVISNVLDPITGEFTTFKEMDVEPPIIDGVVFVETDGKFYQRVGLLNPKMFGAVENNENIDNSEMIQQYIDMCCLVGQMECHINGTYYVNQINITSRHSGIKFRHGVFHKYHRVSAQMQRVIHVWDENEDIHDITIDDFEIYGSAVWSYFTEENRDANWANGGMFNCMSIRAHTDSRIIGLNITNIYGANVGNSVVSVNGAENVFIDNIKGKFVGTHVVVCSIQNMGSNENWPEDYSPLYNIGSVEGHNIRTCIDISTTGASKDDVGPNTPTIHVSSVLARNQIQLSKIHGYWGVRIDNYTAKNDNFFNQGEEPWSALRVYNSEIAYANFGTVSVEGFWLAFANYSLTGPVTIDHLIVRNCYKAVQNRTKLNIGTAELYDIFSPLEMFNRTYSEVSFESLKITHIRKNKWEGILEGIKTETGYWDNVELVDNPIFFTQDNNLFRVGKMELSDVGEDSGTPIPTLFNLSRVNTKIIIDYLLFRGPSTVKLSNFITSNTTSGSSVSYIDIYKVQDSDDFLSDKLLTSLNGRFISNIINANEIDPSKLDGDIFNFTLNRRSNDFVWVDSDGERRVNSNMPSTDTDGEYFFKDRDIITESGTTYSPTTISARSWVRKYIIFTGSAGLININPAIFPLGSELIGEVKGGVKTFVGINGFNLRINDGILPRANTNTRFKIKFESETEGLITISNKVRTTTSVAGTNLTIGNRNYIESYVRLTGSNPGNATIPPDVFEAGDELQGEIEGGDKTFVAGDGVTLRYPEGGTNVAPTNSRFFIKFKSPNDAQLTIVPSAGGSGVESFTDLSDTPNFFTGEAFRELRVSNDETSLVFFNPAIVDYRSTATLNSNNAGTTLNASTVPAVRVTGPGENCFIRGKEAVSNLRFLIVNQKEVSLSLNHNDTDIDEENRFHFENGEDLVLPPGGWADILYVNDRWRIQTVSHPANTYDTFISEINGSTSNPTLSYTEQSGDYALIDRLCHFEIRLNWQSISGGTGNIRIPLPVARHSNTANGGPSIAVMTGLSTNPPIYACYSGFNNITFRNEAGNEISVSDLESEGVIALSGTYIIG